MAVKTISENPTIVDTILIDIQTTDTDGNPITPYRVDQVVIYFVQRSFTSGEYKTYKENVNGQEMTVYYTDAIPVKTFGDGAENPAWLSTDPSDAYIESVPFDEEGVAQTGVFRVTWNPLLENTMPLEGDYMICWKWTPLPASPRQSAHISFIIYGDQQATTAIPSHISPPGKYEALLNQYTPYVFRGELASNDMSPSVLSRLNSAVGKGYNTLEDLVNQILDLIDANATHEALLPYLANLFKHKLWSDDPALWRRQIKRAMALNKKKGTLSGLIEALASAGITLNKLTRYWQIVSSSMWTESFVVGDSTTFTLAKTAILPPDSNFSVSLRGVGEEEYTPLSLNYVSFANVGNETVMTWVGSILSSSAITLVPGDIILVTYKYAPIISQTIEDYIKSLPLMDTRDETTFIYPPKNWNVHLIADDDVLFDLVIPQRHPFAPPVIWGKVRTEFAYSENIFNMDEYNGSVRDSNLPCDIDRTFIDTCSACQSSSISLDLEFEDISNDRITEAEEIIRGYIPFHAQVRAINYSSAINEYMPPPTEDVEILIHKVQNDYMVIGQGDFNRLIPNLESDVGQFLRNELSTAATAASGTATGFNNEVVLYSPGVRFDYLNVLTNNLLEILSGTNIGEYTLNVTDIGSSVIAINQSSPDSIPFPLDTAAFTFRLSNKLWTDAAASIEQADLFTFSDDNINFTLTTILTEVNSVTPWKITINSGIYAGSYNIYDVLPNNTLVLSGWSGIVNASGLSYSLTRNDNTVVFSSYTGKMTVTRRGKITTEELESWGIIEGDWILYSGTQYQIVGFADSNKTQPYIFGYTSGNAAGITITIYRRLLDNTIGYVDVRGMYIITTPDYEALLQVQDGSNPPATPVEISSFMGNYLVQIGSQYYAITGWDGQTITIEGPKTTWGLIGTSVSFSLINYIVTSPIIAYDGAEFSEGVDRRGNEAINITTSMVGMPLDALNNPDGIIESVKAEEAIGFTITNRKGKTIEGTIQC
jgi:hypothetical protein